MARVRVFYENNKKAVIDKEWPATKSQLGKRFVPRAECEFYPNEKISKSFLFQFRASLAFHK